MIRIFRAPEARSVLFAMALLAIAAPAAAYPAPGGGPSGDQPSVYQGTLGGRPVCVLERLGVRYVRPGYCGSPASQAPEETPQADRAVPPGHPPLVPGRDEGTTGTLRAI